MNTGVEICPLVSYPYPSVGNQYITIDQLNTTVTWNNITTTDDNITYTSAGIICTDSGNGSASDVSIAGGIFGVGCHVITCTATNSFGCQRSTTFVFSVYGKLVVHHFLIFTDVFSLFGHHIVTS